MKSIILLLLIFPALCFARSVKFVIITKKDVLAAMRTVIWHLETYDITTIRASIGMYLVCKYVHEKMFFDPYNQTKIRQRFYLLSMSRLMANILQ